MMSGQTIEGSASRATVGTVEATGVAEYYTKARTMEIRGSGAGMN